MTAATPKEGRVLAEGFVFPEGPRWHEGRFWFSDIQGHKVVTVGVDGDHEIVAEFDDEPSGLGFLPDGTPIVVLRKQRVIVRLEQDGTTPLHADLHGYSGPAVGYGPPPHDYMLNDMVVDGAGRAYIGKFIRRAPNDEESERGEAILFVDVDGRHAIAADDVRGPNGLAVTADMKTLIVAETRRFQLTAWSIADDGSLADRRVFADLGENHPDGICLDEEGAVWVGGGSAASGPRFIRVLEGGEIVDSVTPAGDRHTMAPALGGPDRRTLFMATAHFEGRDFANAAGAVQVCDVDVPGAGWP
jgi:sugar lactone lactonase YvrE